MKRASKLVLILSLVFLAGCNLLAMSKEKRTNTLDDFLFAMRWHEFDAAASQMLPELQDDFMAIFQDMDDLQIIEMRTTKRVAEVEGRKLKVTVEMDYYLLPSVAIKTFRFDQTWLFYDPEEGPLHGYYITTPFPAFP
ncbi:MAG: hypothetical protein OET90_05005 [Desulfuromonadales bacterium]|nr:hypothetical protein [Desulfuromonadales bacterium]